MAGQTPCVLKKHVYVYACASIAGAAFMKNYIFFFFLLITFNRVNSSRSFSSNELVISVTNV